MGAASGTKGPRVSLLLLGCNQQRFIEEAAVACLAQQGEALEIVFSDDASTDATFAVLQSVAAAYRGPHVVVVRRNETNLGIAGHYNRLLDVAHGDLLVTAAGDDVPESDRVARLLQAWDATGGAADLVASHVTDVDADGVVQGVLRVDDLSHWRGIDDWARGRPHVIGASHAFTRRVMQRFGPIDPLLHYEDQIMAFRAIASGGAVTVDAPLVRYRRGGLSGRPAFESDDRRRDWQMQRQRREIAEREQLMNDAVVAGCGDVVSAALDDLARRQGYLLQLYGASSAALRWRALWQAEQVPTVWRVRKWLQTTFPGLRV